MRRFRIFVADFGRWRRCFSPASSHTWTHFLVMCVSKEEQRKVWKEQWDVVNLYCGSDQLQTFGLSDEPEQQKPRRQVKWRHLGSLLSFFLHSVTSARCVCESSSVLIQSVRLYSLLGRLWHLQVRFHFTVTHFERWHFNILKNSWNFAQKSGVGEFYVFQYVAMCGAKWLAGAP